MILQQLLLGYLQGNLKLWYNYYTAKELLKAGKQEAAAKVIAEIQGQYASFLTYLDATGISRVINMPPGVKHVLTLEKESKEILGY